MNFDRNFMQRLDLNLAEIQLINSCKSLGLTYHTYPKMITFIEDLKYLDQLNQNKNVSLVLTNHELSKKVNHEIIVVEKPQLYFWSMFNYLQSLNNSFSKSKIEKTTFISESSNIASQGVYIGNNCTIHENVVIKPGVKIGDNVEIMSGVVIGADGFQMKNTIDGLKPIKHDGSVIIGSNVFIGSITNIHKGLMNDTIVKDDTKIDSLVYVAHNCHIGKRVTVAGGTTIGGNVNLGDDIYVGLHAVFAPRVNIASGSFIGAGALVTKSCDQPTTYLGQKSKIKDYVL